MIVMAVMAALCLLLVGVVEGRELWNRHEIQEKRHTISLDSDVQQSLGAYVTLLKATLENDQVVLSRYDQRQRDVAADCEFGYTDGGIPNMRDVKIDVEPRYIQHENGRVTLGVTTSTVVGSSDTKRSDGVMHGNINWSDDHVLTFTTARMAGLEQKTKVPYVIRDDETLFGPDEPGYVPLKDLRKWDKK
jgi:hypothetical protein